MSNSKRSFSTDIWRKILTLPIAVAIWFSINTKLPDGKRVVFFPEHSVMAPVEVLYDKEEIFLENPPGTVLLKYKSIVPRNILPKDFKITLKIQTPHVNSDTLDIKATLGKKNVKSACHGVWYTNLPQEISLRIDRIREKMVDVKANIADHSKNDINPLVAITPATVIIRGPAPVLNPIKRIPTNLISIPPQQREDYEELCELDLQNIEHSERISIPKQVQFVASISFSRDAKFSQHHLYDKPIAVLLPFPSNWSIVEESPLNADITLEGELTDSQIKRIRPFIDLTSASREGTLKIPVQLQNLPNGVKADIRPQEIPLRLQRLPSAPEQTAAE